MLRANLRAAIALPRKHVPTLPLRPAAPTAALATLAPVKAAARPAIKPASRTPAPAPAQAPAHSPAPAKAPAPAPAKPPKASSGVATLRQALTDPEFEKARQQTRILNQQGDAESYKLFGERLVRGAWEPLTGVDLAVVPQKQGSTNACGTTSLSMLMEYWNPGRPENKRETIDRSVRNWNMYTTSADVARYARENGYRATTKAGASLDDIKRLLDQGVPVQVVMESLNRSDPNGAPNKSDMSGHFVTVTGYDLGPDGKIARLSISDPWGLHYTLSADKFMERWDDQRALGLSTGRSRELIAIVPDGDRLVTGPDGVARRGRDIQLPENSLAESIFDGGNGVQTMNQGGSNIVNGLNQFNPLKVVAGVGQAVGGFIGTVGSMAGIQAQKAGDKAIAWASESWRKGGVLNRTGAVLGWVGGGIAKGVGWAVEKASAAVSWAVNAVGEAVARAGDAVVAAAKAVGNAVASAAKAVGNAVASAAKAVGNAAASAAKAVGNAVASFFKGW